MRIAKLFPIWAASLALLFLLAPLGLRAQNMSSYITLTVKKGAEIELKFRAGVENTPIRVVSGSTSNITVGTDWTGSQTFTAGAETMIVYGDLTGFRCFGNGENITGLATKGCTALTELHCYRNLLTALDVSGCTALEKLYCDENNLSTEAYDALFCSLPDRTGKSAGEIHVLNSKGKYGTADADPNTGKVKAANGNNAISKNWEVMDFNGAPSNEQTLAATDFSGSYECPPRVDEVPHMMLRTQMGIGETLSLRLDADASEQEQVWIDLNGNGVRDEGERVTTFGKEVEYTIGTQRVAVCGPVKRIECSHNDLTALDVRANPALTALHCESNKLTQLRVDAANTALDTIVCYNNALSTSGFDALFCALPDRKGKETGYILAYHEFKSIVPPGPGPIFPTASGEPSQAEIRGGGGAIPIGPINPGEDETFANETLNATNGENAKAKNWALWGRFLYPQVYAYYSSKLKTEGEYVCGSGIPVEITANNCDLKLSYVEDGSTIAVNHGDLVPPGVSLTIGVTPKGNSDFTSLAVNGEEFNSQSITYTAPSSGILEVVAVCKRWVIADVTYPLALQGSFAVTRVADNTPVSTGDKLYEGTQLKLEAEAKPGYRLEMMRVDDGLNYLSASNRPIYYTSPGYYTVDKNAKECKISASFLQADAARLRMYTTNCHLKVTQEVNGSTVTFNDMDQVKQGSTISVEVTPDAGHGSSSLEIDGKAYAEKEMPISYTIPSDADECVIRAICWKLVPVHFSVDDPSHGGLLVGYQKDEETVAVNDGDEVVAETVLLITAKPADGYGLTKLTIDGVEQTLQGGNLYKYTIPTDAADCNIAAEFGELPVVKIAQPTGGKLRVTYRFNEETIKVTPEKPRVPFGAELTIEAIPDEGYLFESIQIDQEAPRTKTPTTYTVPSGATEVNISGKFAWRKAQIAIEPPENGEVTVTYEKDGSAVEVSDGDEVPVGAVLTISATPAEGYYLEEINVLDSVYKRSPAEYTIPLDREVVRIVAWFTDQPNDNGSEPTAVESALLAGVTVGPNPFGALLQVQHAVAVQRYSLRNSLGQSVLSGSHSGGSVLQLHTAHLPSGLYLLVLHAEDGVRTLKVVKQ